MDYGFFRLACESPEVKIADCNANAQMILKSVKKAAQKNADCIVFPALSLTGCTCANLFMQDSLLNEVRLTLTLLAKRTKDFDGLCVVGAPIVFKNALFNCAVFIGAGRILAIVPQTHIMQPGTVHSLFPFESARSIKTQEVIDIEGCRIPFGTDIMIRFNQSTVIAAEICADLYAAQPPSIFYALAGACLIVNLGAKRYTAGQSDAQRRIVQTQSEKLCCAYIYVQSGQGESSTDSVFSAHNIIAENGKILAESDLFKNGSLIQDIDIQLLTAERLKTRDTDHPVLIPAVSPAAGEELQNCRIIDFYTQRFQKKNAAPKTVQKTAERKKQTLPAADKNVLYRHISALPFMPEEPAQLYAYCREAAAIQAQGLAMRMRNTGIYKAVIGISGGLDSALALLAARDALKILSLSTRNITAISMPCFGTSERTFTNAARLANALGVDFKEIPIQNAVKSHLADIGHNENVHNAVYENAQARERTQVLMDIANEKNALVVGTGDLSELALGWATYNGDQMSMYAVNASVPKTLVRALVRYHADNADKNADAHSTCESQQSGCSFHCVRSTRSAGNNTCASDPRSAVSGHSLAEVLYDILDTPVSPELLPPDKSGISQKTEELVGPYELHDFFLYYAVRYGFSPAKIIFLAGCAFGTKYTHKQLCSWLELFYRRFFSQQFKRSCMPDGVSIGEVSLSPRGFWNMPSDASSALWLKEIEELKNRKA